MLIPPNPPRHDVSDHKRAAAIASRSGPNGDPSHRSISTGKSMCSRLITDSISNSCGTMRMIDSKVCDRPSR